MDDIFDISLEAAILVFNEEFYLANNPDIAAAVDAGVFTNGAEHYLSFGFDEGRIGSPVQARVFVDGDERSVFDEDFYLASNPFVQDLIDAGDVTSALDHYILIGADQDTANGSGLVQFDPNTFFDTAAYLAANPDVAAAGINPYFHFLQFGEEELLAGNTARAAGITGVDVVAYAEGNPDVAAIVETGALTFFQHFLQFGRFEIDPISGEPNRAGITFADTPPPPAANEALLSDQEAGPDGLATLNVAGTAAVGLDPAGDTDEDGEISITGGDGLDVLRLIGNRDVRIDFTTASEQLEGFDLDGDGTIEAGAESDVRGLFNVSGFEVVDAFARNPLTPGDTTQNFTGTLEFDGTGVGGSGFGTDGNIVLGGVAADTILGGIGNDFIVGGGGADSVFGGRNADFFFIDISLLDSEFNSVGTIDGGSTFDFDEAQDSDFLLIEASDDEDGTEIDLDGGITSGTGQNFGIAEIENVDASGNIFGFLDGAVGDALQGVRLGDLRDAPLAAIGDGSFTEDDTIPFGVGSTAQLIITGTDGANIVIGGFDNDTIKGEAGDDILFGGRIDFLLDNRNNPNLFDADGGLIANTEGADAIADDGEDTINGGDGDDLIVADFGGADTIDGEGSTNSELRDDLGGLDGDTLAITDFSFGFAEGATTGAAQAFGSVLEDGVLRIDLGNQAGLAFQGFGGANVGFNAIQSNLESGVERGSVDGIENVIATGIGAIDFNAIGSGESEFIDSQQDFAGVGAVNLDVRGDNAANVIFTDAGNDVIEGREGDDILGGNGGIDDFIFQAGDGTDLIARQSADGTSFERDFGLGGDVLVTGSVLIYQFTDASDIDNIGGVAFKLDGQTVSVLIDEQPTLTDVANAIDAELDAAGFGDLTVEQDGTSIIINDPDGGEFKSAAVTALVNEPGNPLDFFATTDPSDLIEVSDRLVFTDYAVRATNTRVDETENQLALQAADFALDFTGSGRLSNGQETTVTIGDTDGGTSFADEDVELAGIAVGSVITITINGVDFTETLTVDDKNGLADVLDRFQTAIQATDTGSLLGDVEVTLGNADNDKQNDQLIIAEAGGGSIVSYDVSVSIAGLGEAFVEDTSDLTVELEGFNLREEGLNAGLADDADSPLEVLFVGKGDGDLNFEDDENTSLLFIAEADADGVEVTGTDGTTLPDDTVINGDDLIVGSDGDDTIETLSGEDVIYGTLGDDTIDAGEGDDTIVFNSALFGDGTRFTIEINLDKTATVVATDADGDEIGETEIVSKGDLIRTLSDVKDDTIDLKDISDSIVAGRVGDDVIGNDDADDFEGLNIELFGDKSTITFDQDVNDNDVLEAGEKDQTLTAVDGVENVITGNSNDQVTVNETQAVVENIFDLGGEVDGKFGAGNNGENGDQVVIDHSGITAASDRPSVTVVVENTADSDTVTLTGGVLGSTEVTDTLVDVEFLDVALAATGETTQDTIDLSQIAGGAVAFTAQAVNKTEGDDPTDAVDTVSEEDAATLATGGIADLDAGALGTELLEITGIGEFEVVKGSSGNDAVFVADDQDGDNTNDGKVKDSAGVDSFVFDIDASDTADDIANPNLFSFNLGDGKDFVDFRAEGGDIAFAVTAAGATTALVDTDSAGVGAAAVDYSASLTDVEWIIVGAGESVLDLKELNEDVVITFANGSSLEDPLGEADATTKSLSEVLVELDDADGTDLVRFFESGTNTLDIIEGSDKDETIKLSDLQSTSDSYQFNLRGGTNTIDYSALKAPVDGGTAGVTAAVTSFDEGVTTGDDLVDVTVNVTSAGGTTTDQVATVEGQTVIVGTVEDDTIDISAVSGTTVEGVTANLETGTIIDDKSGQTLITVTSFENLTGTANDDSLTGSAAGNTLDGGDGDDVINGAGGDDVLTGGLGEDEITGASGADQIDAGADGEADLIFFLGKGDGNAVVTDDVKIDFAEADVITNFDSGGAAGDDEIVIGGALQDLLAGDRGAGNPSNFGIVQEAAAGGFDADVAGTFFSTTAAANAFDDDSIAIGDILTAIGGIANLAVGDSFIFVVTDATNGDTGIIYAEDTDDGAGGAADGNLTADDTFALLGVIDGGVIVDDLRLQIDSGPAGDDINLTNSAAGVAVEISFDAVGDSPAGNGDEITALSIDPAFEDIIDLSALDLDLNDNDGDTTITGAENIDVRTPVSVNDPGATLLNDFFFDAGLGGDVAVVVQEETGTSNFRVFVDINGDGDYTAADDLVFDLLDVDSDGDRTNGGGGTDETDAIALTDPVLEALFDFGL